MVAVVRGGKFFVVVVFCCLVAGLLVLYLAIVVGESNDSNLLIAYIVAYCTMCNSVPRKAVLTITLASIWIVLLFYIL